MFLEYAKLNIIQIFHLYSQNEHDVLSSIHGHCLGLAFVILNDIAILYRFQIYGCWSISFDLLSKCSKWQETMKAPIAQIATYAQAMIGDAVLSDDWQPMCHIHHLTD